MWFFNHSRPVYFLIILLLAILTRSFWTLDAVLLVIFLIGLMGCLIGRSTSTWFFPVFLYAGFSLFFVFQRSFSAVPNDPQGFILQVTEAHDFSPHPQVIAQVYAVRTADQLWKPFNARVMLAAPLPKGQWVELTGAQVEEVSTIWQRRGINFSLRAATFIYHEAPPVRWWQVSYWRVQALKLLREALPQAQ